MPGRCLLKIKQFLCLLVLGGVGAFNQAMGSCLSTSPGGFQDMALPTQAAVASNAPLYTVIASATGPYQFRCTAGQSEFGYANGIAEVVRMIANPAAVMIGDHLFATETPGVGVRVKFDPSSMRIGYQATNISSLFFNVTFELVKIGEIANGSRLPGFYPILLQYSLVSGGPANAGPVIGHTITFNVQEPRASCRLTNPNLVVPLRDVSINELNANGRFQVVKAGTFNIGVACTSNARATLAFTDARNSANGLLQLNANVTGQKIDGVGLNILWADQGQNLVGNSNGVSTNLFSNNLEQSIPFAVYYQPQGQVIMPGAFTSVANITLTYQ